MPDVPSEQLDVHSSPIIQLIDDIIQLLNEGNRKDAFVLIFINNIKGCLLNIVGGVVLGLGTFFNLVFNGFGSADMFVASYEAGLSINEILKATLPHSFELLGFWLSGGMGFYFAWSIIQFIRKNESFSSHFYKQMGVCAIIVFILILSAAYVEAYISTSISLE